MNILLLSCGRSSYFLKELFNWKIIKKKKLCIITADNTSLPTYLKYTNKNYLVKKTSDKKYLNQILKIIKYEKIDYILPFNDFDLKFIIDNQSTLKKFSKVFSSDKKNLILSLNKLYAKNLDQVLDILKPMVDNKSILLLQGAGDIKNIISMLRENDSK